jgi:preprotein translocase subunit SecE
MQKVLAFLSEAKIELSRVNWPSRKQITQYTILVIIMSLAMAIFLGGLDFSFSFLVERYLLR